MSRLDYSHKARSTPRKDKTVSNYRVIPDSIDVTPALIARWKSADNLAEQLPPPAKDANYDQRLAWEKKRDKSRNDSCVAIACYCSDGPVWIPLYAGKDTLGADFFIDGVQFHIGVDRTNQKELRWSIRIERPHEFRNQQTPCGVHELWQETTHSITVSGNKSPRDVNGDVCRRLLENGKYLYQKTREAFNKQSVALENRNARIWQYQKLATKAEVRGDLNDPFSSPCLHWSYSPCTFYGDVKSICEESASFDLNNVPHALAEKIIALLNAAETEQA